MNAIDGSLSNYGLIGQVGIAANALDSRQTTLTAQSTSGLVSTGLTGLGPDTSRVLNLQPQLAQISALTANATLAGSSLQTAQTALTSISSIASTLATNLTQLTAQGGSSLATGITSLALTAKSDLASLASTLNTTSGDVYVFGGVNETTQPVVDPNSINTGPMAASVASAVNGLSTNGAAATLSSVVAAVSGNSVFASDLSTTTPAASIDVGAGERATVGLPATSGVGMQAASPDSTGSSVNDLIAVLSAVSNLAPSQAAAPQLGSFLSGLQSILGGSQQGLSAMTSTLGVAQQQVAAANDTNAAVSDALTSQIGSLTSVDLPTVATRLIATQNQLMASYEIVSDLKNLSLAAYL